MRVEFKKTGAVAKWERSDLRKLRDAAQVLQGAHSIAPDEVLLRALIMLDTAIEKVEFAMDKPVEPPAAGEDQPEFAVVEDDDEHPFPPAAPRETIPPAAGSFGEKLEALRNRDAQRQMREASGQPLSNDLPSDESPLEPV